MHASEEPHFEINLTDVVFRETFKKNVMNTLKNKIDNGSLVGESFSIRKINGRVVIKNMPTRSWKKRSDGKQELALCF